MSGENYHYVAPILPRDVAEQEMEGRRTSAAEAAAVNEAAHSGGRWQHMAARLAELADKALMGQRWTLAEADAAESLARSIQASMLVATYQLARQAEGDVP